MDLLVSVNKAVGNFVWGPVMLVLLLGTGLYLTIRTGFFSITKLGYVLKNTIMTLFQKQETKGEGEITPFQAVSTALAATVGTVILLALQLLLLQVDLEPFSGCGSQLYWV